MDVKTIVEKRVMCMENIYKDMLNSIIKGFEAYEIALYNNHGEFDYLDVKSQCISRDSHEIPTRYVFYVS